MTRIRQGSSRAEPVALPATNILTINKLENNLSYMRTEAPVLAPIFRSEGQARLLAAVLLDDDELSLTELAARADVAYPTAHREIGRLIDAGILDERQVGRTRMIRAADDSPLVAPLRDIITVTAGPVSLLRHELAAIDGIESAFLYGSFAARLEGQPGAAPHDIDVMVIGAPDLDALYAACERVEDAVHRPVNPTVLSSSEVAERTGFLDSVRAGAVVLLTGDLPW